MPIYDASDIVDLKNKKKRKKRLKHIAIVLLLVTVGTGLYFTQELWLPKLHDLGETYQTIVNDGRLAAGNFPIEVTGDSKYQMQYTGNTLVVVSDAYVTFYSQEGGAIKHHQHAYTNPVMRTAAGKALVYESGGNEFIVEDSNTVLYKNHFENSNIMFARLSDEGYTAVVTTSENYDCEVFVYDRKGTCIYRRKCIERVNDISFTDNSRGCVISYIYAENGSLSTSVQSVNFNEEAENWSSPGLDTLGLEVSGFDGGAFVLGIDACGYINNNGQISSYYSYDGELADGESCNGQSAVIINNDDRRKYTLTLFDGVGSEPIVISLNEPLIQVAVENCLAYVMSQNMIYAYDFGGTLRSTAQINDSYTGFAKSSTYIFLKSFNKIDRIDYES